MAPSMQDVPPAVHDPKVSVNATRLNATLHESCQWGCTPDGGMNRLSLNDDDKSVREWFVEEVKSLGCSVNIDAMGNIFAIRPGKDNSIPPIAIGSHLDTQPQGGRYDGILGVLAGLEALRVLHEHNVQTKAPIAVVNWTNEEGARFSPAMISSGVWAGAFELDFARNRADADGKTMGEELERIGFTGETPCSHTANPLSAHFELHIEQGPILESKNLAVAAVVGVQAMRWFTISVHGRPQHTGTTPLASRADAMLSAARMIVSSNGIAKRLGALASTGVINASPQSVNTLAGEVSFSLDLRATSDDLVEQLERECREALERIGEEEGVSVEVDRYWVCPATIYDEIAVEKVRESARRAGLPFAELTSGAGHDSVYTARRCPTAMIFIRCKGGISHNPAEYSSPEDCAAGAEVLLGAVLGYDAYLAEKSK